MNINHPKEPPPPPPVLCIDRSSIQVCGQVMNLTEPPLSTPTNKERRRRRRDTGATHHGGGGAGQVTSRRLSSF